VLCERQTLVTVLFREGVCVSLRSVLADVEDVAELSMSAVLVENLSDDVYIYAAIS
jgi:hypothetical protein